MVITAQVETFNNLNQCNLPVKCRWPWLLCIVRTIYFFITLQSFLLNKHAAQRKRL